MTLSTVILSHLSNAEEIMKYHPLGATENIEFVKFLILKYPNTDIEVTGSQMTDDLCEFKSENN